MGKQTKRAYGHQRCCPAQEQMNRGVNPSASHPHLPLSSQCLLEPTQHCLLESHGDRPAFCSTMKASQVGPGAPFLSLTWLPLRTPFSPTSFSRPLSFFLLAVFLLSQILITITFHSSHFPQTVLPSLCCFLSVNLQLTYKPLQG